MTQTVDVELVCAACDCRMVEVTVENCRPCAERGPAGRHHFECQNPRCPLQLDPRKTVVCARLNPGGPEA